MTQGDDDEGTSVPPEAFDTDEPIEATVAAAVEGERASEFPCPVCDRLQAALDQRGASAEFPVSPLAPTTEEMTALGEPYQAFRDDLDVRVRYYVQAHLHWFGYFPELRGRPRTEAIPHRGARGNGFPSHHVNGLWSDRSRDAYEAFLEDVAAATGWTREADVLREADLRLVRLKCGELFNRPDFSYYLDYRISNDGRTLVRPYLRRPIALSVQAGDPALADFPAADDLAPLQELRCHGATVSADLAPSDLPADVIWPVVTNPDPLPEGVDANDPMGDDDLPAELRAKGITAAALRRLYPLYKYNPERFVISFEGRDAGGHARARGASGRKFNAQRPEGRMHGGIDVYADYGDPVHAILPGRIVGFHSAAPMATCFLFVFSEALGITVNYGEVHHESLLRLGLMVGDTVERGQHLGNIGRMSSTARGGSMLHFEVHRGQVSRWFMGTPPSNVGTRLNPTPFLLAIRRRLSDAQAASAPPPEAPTP